MVVGRGLTAETHRTSLINSAWAREAQVVACASVCALVRSATKFRTVVVWLGIAESAVFTIALVVGSGQG